MTRLAATARAELASGVRTGYRALRRAIPHRWWSALRGSVPPALRYSVRRRWSVTPASIGTISVVVPCYDVERYLRSSLTSIIAQSYTDLEVIVVIDGSPDRSAAIARGFSRWDHRIRVIGQPNAGLGAARNTGIRAATGDFIAFVDPDDWLPPDAYTVMTQTLGRSGSDFVVGNVERQRGHNAWVPVWARDVHRYDRLRLTLDDYPEILADVFSWNKLFRREFFNRAVGGFPEGIRYEDQEATAKAYASATSFDVLHEVTYRWFIRGDQSSITQQKSTLGDLHDRLTVMTRVSDVLTTRASQRVVRYWQAKAVGLDLRAYYNEVPRTGTAYWDALRQGVRYVTAQMDESAWRLVDVQDRLLARMVEADARDDACVALVSRSDLGDGLRVDLQTDPPTGVPLYLDQISWTPGPRDLLLSPNENRIRAVLTGYEADERSIRLTGMAFLPGADLSEARMTACLRRRADHALLPAVAVAVERFCSAPLDQLAANAATSHAHDGFRAAINAEQLLDALEQLPNEDGEPAEVYLELVLETGGQTWRNHLTHHDRRGAASRLLPGPLTDGHRIAARYGHDVGLRLRRVQAQVITESVEVTDRRVRLTVRSLEGSPVERLTVRCRALGLSTTARPEGRSAHAVTFRVPDLPPGVPPLRQHVWRVSATVHGQEHDVALAMGAAELMTQAATVGLRADSSASGRLQFFDRKRDAVVTRVEVAPAGDIFTVHGLARLPAREPFLAAFVSDSDAWWATDARWDPVSGSFSATFRTVQHEPGIGDVVPASTGYSFRLVSNPRAARQSLWVPVLPGTVPDPSVPFLGWHVGARAALRFLISSNARALWLNVRPPLPRAVAGRHAQYRLQQTIPSLLRSPLEETAVFSCFGGRPPGDSPLAIQSELRRGGYDGRILWAARDGSAAAPEGTEAVLLGSPEYYRALHTSRWLINNNNFPYYFRKHPDQYYLQTWHGTPLKRIAEDVPGESLSLSYRALMKREPQWWDVLLAQNDFAAGIFPDAFGYRGPVLTLGYPRNDQLALTNAERRATIRRRLGIPSSARVLLYAPTWRDNLRTASNGYAAVTFLDVAKVSRWLADDGVFLLRGHSNTAGFPGADAYPNVRDLSRYPDVGDLLEITDVLVTDYSSVMFDFAVTGRPIVFLAPDLDEYASSTRGLYLDLGSIAPGPILRTTDEVISVLADPAALALRYGRRYTAFQERFTSLDDGAAARRVVEHVWSKTS
ncbi:MAG: CDP-glycerol glycerophosphotransferase family protein [Intrasporangium sp.]|uniref:bifunctional glycosyltransferase/CDP-glycerol:glycerophosphate glycerophosphotransferase n=1 Tax=Intrasporangium sp. TaxID=1925024 RepID=UPI003F7DF248